VGATNSFSKASRGVYTPLWLYNGCLTLQQECLGKSIKSLAHFARGREKPVREEYFKKLSKKLSFEEPI
jgi:hypothetical protein